MKNSVEIHYKFLVAMLAITVLCGCTAELSERSQQESQILDARTVEFKFLEPSPSPIEMPAGQIAHDTGANLGTEVSNQDLAQLADAVIAAGEQSREAQEAFEASVKGALRAFDEITEGSTKQFDQEYNKGGSNERAPNMTGGNAK